MAKVIKAEGKAEKKALDDAVKELADIQKLQKSAVKVRYQSAVYMATLLIIALWFSRKRARHMPPTRRCFASSARWSLSTLLHAPSTSARKPS